MTAIVIIKKFKCNECLHPCMLEVENGITPEPPIACPYIAKAAPNWIELKEE